MANEQNLKHFTSNQSREEAVRNGQKGGIASGESRRARKTLREELIMLLEMDDNNRKISTAILEKALAGDITAFTTIRDTIGEKPAVQQNIHVSESPKLADVISQLGGEGLSDDE